MAVASEVGRALVEEDPDLDKPPPPDGPACMMSGESAESSAERLAMQLAHPAAGWAGLHDERRVC